MTTRLSRAEQVERNRALVLEAAREVFLDHGYAGAGVDAIALRAGFSKGVVYSQFASKADLLLALLAERIEQRAAENLRLVEGRSGLPGLRHLLAGSARRTAADAGWALLLIEFRVVAARDDALGARYAALHERSLTAFGEAVTAVLARGGLAPAASPRRVAQLVFALSSGVVLEHAVDPGTAVDPLLDALSAALAVPAPPPGDPRPAPS